VEPGARLDREHRVAVAVTWLASASTIPRVRVLEVVLTSRPREGPPR